MELLHHTFLSLATAAGSLAACPGNAEPVALHLLVRTEQGLEVHRDEINEGETRAFQSNASTGIVSVILPPGPGGSGSIEQLGVNRVLIVQRQNDKIRFSARVDGGKAFDGPELEVAELDDWRIHLSVNAGDGSVLSGVIEDWTFRPDDIGMLINPFAGAVPLGPDDFAVYTTTTARADADPAIDVSTNAEFFEGHLFVRGPEIDGAPSWFVIDLGAATSVMARGALPPGTTIREASMMQYSTTGVDRLAFEPGGATGKIEGILGYASVPELHLGDIMLRGAEPLVMPSLPSISGRPLAGIIGADILQQAQSVIMSLPPAGSLAASLRLCPASPADDGPMSFPFVGVGDSLYGRMEVNGVPVRVLLDTGAVNSVLDAAAAAAAGIEPTGPSRRLAGLDGKGIEFRSGVADSVKIGEFSSASEPFDIAPLPVFSKLRGQHPVGLLGNSFFGQFQRVEFDFEADRVRLTPRGE